jgi:hypothetical protein
LLLVVYVEKIDKEEFISKPGQLFKDMLMTIDTKSFSSSALTALRR